MTARKKPAAAKAAPAARTRVRQTTAPQAPAQPSHAVRSIPLDRLRLSTLYNVRITQDAPIEPLADSIAAKGLLQNLIAVVEDDGWHGVCAGGRRLAALRLNAERGLIAPDTAVACIVVEAAEARIVSLAENYARSIMNPADEARAFADLIDEGRTAAEVAATFGVTERHVRARQRLGRLAAPVMAAFARREMTIEQAQAFAVVDDAGRQEAVFAVWSKAAAWDRGAGAIKRLMTDARIGLDSALGRFVGREAYETAGGAVDEDLFSEDVWFADADLVTRLATARLEAAANLEVAAGWKWSAIMLEANYQLIGGLRRIYPEEAPLSEADQARWEEIQGLMEDGGLTDDEAERLEAELEALEDSTRVYTDAQKAMAGVAVFVTRGGALGYERGLQRGEDIAPEARPAPAAHDDHIDGDGPGAGAVVTIGADDAVRGGARGGGKDGGKEGGTRDPYSASLRDDMRTVLKGALQVAVAEDPGLALDLLQFHAVMAARASYGFREGVLALSLGDQTARLRGADGWRYDEETDDLPAARVDGAWATEPGVAARFAAFRRLSAADKAALTAAVVAQGLQAALSADDGYDEKPRIALTAGIVTMAQPEVRRIWRPTKDNFLSRVSKAVLLEIIEATLGAEEARRSMGAKKGELVALLHGAFNEQGERRRWDDAARQRLDFWVPAPMRHDDVGGPVAGAGEAADEAADETVEAIAAE